MTAPFKLQYILIGAIALRVVAALTNLRSAQPDEWFATVEYANLFINSTMTLSVDFYCHMRNLTWPALLALPFSAMNALFDQSPYSRIVAVKLFVAVLDFAILWGACRLIFEEREYPNISPSLVAALFTLPWFLVEEAVRPTIEHASAIACWLALGLLTGRRSRVQIFFAGVACVLTGAFRYPSGLLGVGIVIAIIIRLFRDRQFRAEFYSLAFALGIAAGIFIGGFADYVVFGRPWESFWMYLQFNVFTNLSSSIYGAHSVVVYFEYLADRFFAEFLLFSLIGLLTVPIGMYRGIRSLQPWAFALLFFAVGHLFPAHKEGRFLSPTFHLIIWAGIYGLYILRRRISFRWLSQPRVKRLVQITILLTIVANTVRVFEVLRGEWGKSRMVYFSALRIAEESNACALITVTRAFGSWLPIKHGKDLRLATGVLAVNNQWSPENGGVETANLYWIENFPKCLSGNHLVLHTHKPSTFWTENMNCSEVAEFSKFNRIYRCPFNTIEHFKNAAAVSLLEDSIQLLPKLPPLGVSGNEFLNYCTSEEQRKSLNYSGPYSGG